MYPVFFFFRTIVHATAVSIADVYVNPGASSISLYSEDLAPACTLGPAKVVIVIHSRAEASAGFLSIGISNLYKSFFERRHSSCLI
jgi:hypothetical protein